MKCIDSLFLQLILKTLVLNVPYLMELFFKDYLQNYVIQTLNHLEKTENKTCLIVFREKCTYFVKTESTKLLL